MSNDSRQPCKARVWNDGRTWGNHQCRNRAATERTVNRLADGSPRRIPVCRIHVKQRRSDFAEYQP